VIVNDRVARHFDEHVLACGLTYYAHPTACAAAVETLKVYEEEHMFENAARLGPVLRSELDRVAARLPQPVFVRSLGLLGALEVTAPAEAWARLSTELAERRLSLHVDGKRGTAIFSPPLCITEDELVIGMRGFGDAARLAFGGAE
jgi:taurine---2-oxoglutarate transaminase